MKVAELDLYFQGILNKIEEYQRGNVPLDEIKRIPKEDLLKAMHDECSRITRNIKKRNEELESQFNPTTTTSINSYF